MIFTIEEKTGPIGTKRAVTTYVMVLAISINKIDNEIIKL